MTIEDLGNLGEMIAAIATVATLIYLAQQIRKNSINFGTLNECNSLFLLRHVSAKTPENRRKRVFQQNRPEAAIDIRLV
jgi:hypothetical protein